MTNKITKEFLFTELSIKIATLEMKIDKVLELLSKPEITIDQDISFIEGPDTVQVGSVLWDDGMR